MGVPARPVTPPPAQTDTSPSERREPPRPWFWKVLVVLAAAVGAAGIAREIESRRRIRAIQLMPVRDLGTQTLTVAHNDQDPELRHLSLELRAIVDAGMQRVRPGTANVGRERTGV